MEYQIFVSANSAKYYHNCAARYNKQELEALKQRNAEEIKDPWSTSHSTCKSCGLAIELRALLCSICGQEDDIKCPLCSWSIPRKETENRFKTCYRIDTEGAGVATIVDNQYLLSVTGDVASKELYYHSGCLTTLNSNYLRIKNNSSCLNDNTDWVKALLNTCMIHIKRSWNHIQS